jgi:D-alanine-D-alanine ligase-like ATP-grasp enzyme
MQMLKKFACAVALVFVASIALAETLSGFITKAGKDEVTIVTGKKGEEKTTHKIKVTADTKVVLVKGKKGKDKEDSTISALTEAIEKSKGGKGVRGSVEVTDKKATAISYRAGKKKSAE